MKSLIIKDSLVLSKRIKRMLFIVPVLAFAGTTGLVMALLVCGLLVNTTFAYDDLAKWQRLACMMPYSARDIVLSKFVLGYLTLAIGTVCVTIIQLIIFAVYPPLVNLDFGLIFGCVLLTLLTIALYIPTIFKIGVEKSRFIPAIFVIALSALLSYLSASSVDGISRLDSIAPVVMSIAPVVVVLINIVSIIVSINIYNSNVKKSYREFYVNRRYFLPRLLAC